MRVRHREDPSVSEARYDPETVGKIAALATRLQSPVIDRAAVLQKRAAPGDILVGEELADIALAEWGSLSRLPEPVAGSPAFSWRSGGQRGVLPEAGKPD